MNALDQIDRVAFYNIGKMYKAGSYDKDFAHDKFVINEKKQYPFLVTNSI